MVNILGNKDNGLKAIQKSLEDNLNITASDSRLKTIVDKITDSRYRIKDLSTITGTIFCIKLAIIDGRLFLLPRSAYVGTIEVRDYQNNTLLKTINDGANAETPAICFDDDYIYISKCVQRITDKRYRDIYVRKYNRCTLELVSESPILYTGISATSSANSSNIFEMVENGEYLYLACVQTMDTAGIFDKIRKIKKTDFSSVADIAWNLPLNLIKHTSGFFVTGANGISGDAKYRRIDLLDWDLGIIQTFPSTTITIDILRKGFYKDDYLYVCSDNRILVKYQISTNTIIKEIPIVGTAYVRNLISINDNFLLIYTNASKIMLYDADLNFIKTWSFYSPTSTGGQVASDNNNTIWTQTTGDFTTIYKKQFVDLTKDVI